MVFGESAGAMSIGTLLAMPAAAGLFHRAILQSGAAAAYHDREQAEAVAAQMLAAFGGSVDRLRAAPAEEVLAAQAAVTGRSDGPSYLAFRPMVDGVQLPEAPDVAIRGGRSWAPRHEVAVIVGTNRDEMTLFVQFDAGADDMSETQLERRGVALFGAERWRHLAGGYRRIRPHTAARWVAVTTDLVFRMPAVRLAEALAAQGPAPVFMYRLDWSSPVRGGYLGATHGLDIPFMWDLLDYPGVELFTGTAPGRRQLAQAMHGAWLAFAQRGVPAAPDLPAWPAYRPPARATMIFDAPCRVEEDPNGEERRLWDAVA
jgi:para-nitrobenzyl esterase